MAVKAVLLDLDGTLWDSHPWFARLIAERTRRPVADVLNQVQTGHPPIARLLDQAGISKATFRRACANCILCRLYPHAAATLRALQDEGVPAGVVTNLPAWMALPMLARADLEGLIRDDAVAHYRTTPRHKPAPDPLLHVMQALDVEPARSVWYIGDTDVDAQAARAAGVSFAWAEWGYGGTPVDADRTLTTLEEVLSL